jgi:PGF-pre-PGF domain-containing protein
MKILALIAACLLLFTAAYASDSVVARVSIATPPIVSINTPVSTAWYSSSLIVNASIAGTAHAATYQWRNSSANGTYVPMANISNGIWTANFNTSVLADGNYTLLVNASNRFNMTGNKTVDFHIDNTAPVISSFVLTKTDTIYVGSTLTSADFSCSATDNSESFGGSVAVVITGLSTLTSGTKTATCTATDSVGNTDTKTVQYTVTSTVGGGGSSSSGDEIRVNKTNVTNKSVAALEQVPAERTISLAGFPKPVASIGITTAQTISNSDIQVSILSSAEPVPNAKVFAYLDITTNVPEGAITSASIIFEVDKSWLAENNFSPDSIILYRLVGGTWSVLSTSRTGETADTYTYIAITPGFSTFAIAATIASPATGNAVTGSAISPPAIPLSTNTMVLGLMALVMIATIVITRMRSAKGKSRRR